LVPVLHPALAEMYRERLAKLRETLESQGGREALEAARALIDCVEISPPTDGEPGPRIELIGHLTALLRTAGVDGMPLIKNAKSPPELTDGLVLFLRSQSGDAGTRKQLDLLLVGSGAHPNLPPTSRRKVKN
jgi:hypothetical protein